jgi:hypothetical protein
MALTSSGNGSLYPTRPIGPYERATPLIAGNRLQITIFCWARVRAAPSGIQSFFGLGSFTASNFFQLRITNNHVVSARYANFNALRTAEAASSSNIVATNEWFAAAATMDCNATNTTAVRLFIKNTSFSSSTGSDTGDTVFDNATFFRRPITTSTEVAPNTTDVAEAAIWAGALTQAEFDMLAAGANPLTVAQGRNLGYFPLLGDLRDLSPVETWLRPVGAWTPAYRDHPPVQLPPRRKVLKAASGTTYNLTATSIAAGSSVGTPSLSQNHALAADGISASSTVGAPSLDQIRNLVATGIAAASTVGTPGLTQEHALTATGISAGSSVGVPTLNASPSTSRALRLPARDRSARLPARDRTVRLEARDRTVTLSPERN